MIRGRRVDDEAHALRLVWLEPHLGEGDEPLGWLAHRPRERHVELRHLGAAPAAVFVTESSTVMGAELPGVRGASDTLAIRNVVYDSPKPKGKRGVM